MTLRLGFVLMLIFVPVTSTNGVESDVRNGFWWMNLNRIEKIMFIEGYIDGISRADQLLQMYISIDTLQVNAKAKKETVIDHFNFYNVTYGQLLEGMDTFYGDYRNKRILFNYAALYIRDQIRGVSRKELDDRIEHMRQATTQDNYDKQ